MFFVRCYFCVSMLAALLRALFFAFYRRRAAREQYFRRFIVTVRRGNNIFAVLSSPCSAGTIFLPFYRRRAAREQYFRVSSLAALLRALKFLFHLCGMAARVGMVGAVPVCPPERPRSGVSIRKCGAAIRKCCVSICERHASMCKRDVPICERHRQTMDAPLRGARAGTQAPPLPRLSNRQQTPKPF